MGKGGDLTVKDGFLNPVQPVGNEPDDNYVIPVSDIQNAQPVDDEKDAKAIIPLGGKLITSEDPVLVGKNFKTLTNMRYGSASPRSISGMTKINSSVINGTYLKTRNAFQFRKTQPDSIESHILAQSYNSGITASKVYENTTVPPSAGNFTATEVWSDDADAGYGYFSDAPDGNVVYCNGVETCIWGGAESRCVKFLNFDPAGTFMYDYTDAVTNTKTDTQNLATFASTGNGIDSDVTVMLHLDNNVTDSSPTTAHTVTNNNVTFSNSVYVFGYSAVFNGTTAYLSIPDDDDFDLSGGIWTYDLRVRCTNFTANNPLYYQKTDLTKISFINGAHEPVTGETITGNTSSATGVVDSVVLDSGDWGGTAAGTIYMHTVTGTWQNAENIKDPDTNVIALSDSTASDAGDNYTSIFVDTDGKVNVLIHECYGSGSDVVDITCGTALVAATWYHIEIGESAGNWYIFIDGQLKSITSDASRAKNYIGNLQIGYDNTNYFVGYLDEIRLSKNKLRHSSDFTIPAAAYTTSTADVNVYIGSLRPLKGVKFYTHTENTAPAVATGYYCDGSNWTALVLTDGTATVGGTKTLGQTGSITFPTTVGSAKQKYIEGVPLYYYWFVFSGIDTSTSVYYVTLDAPFQEMVDFWDGEDRLCAAFYKFTTAYTDYTINITEDSYDTAYADTYADFGSLGAYSAGCNGAIAGFFEQVTAINLSIPSDRRNSTAATVMAIDYWDGSDWKSVGVVSDGTAEGGISLSKPGTASFNAPDPWLVFKRISSYNSMPLYYYRIRWNQTLDATTGIYHVSGIPTQKQIKGYKFPLYSQDRLMLCGNKDGAQNTVLISAYETAQVFNGNDSMEITFGSSTAINCGCTLFAMYGSILYNITVLFKDSEMWGLVYSDNAWRKYRIAETIGCPAPMTLATCIIPPEEGQSQNNRSFAIWMAADGVYTSDGRHPVCVSWDIRDLFDQNSSSHINQSYIESFSGFIDKNLMEYHLMVALTTGTVTTLDAEYVLDLRKWKWYKVDRTSGVRLQCGISVLDSYGNNHSYGFIDSGYMERLEYGTTFDGQAIVSTLHTGDFPLIDKDFLVETSLRGHVLVTAAKTYETMTLDVAPGGAGWSVGETVTGVSSGKTCKIAAKASGTSYTVYQRSGAYTLGEVLTNGTTTADQGEDYPTFTASVTATHYVDSSTTGTDYTVAANNVTKRLSFPVNTANSTPGIFHSIKYVFTSSYETVGFEPLVVGLYYHPIRDYDYE